MKRRVIQIAESTQLVSLPRKWAKKYNIKKGDELEVEIEGSSVRITTDNVIEVTKKELDLKDLEPMVLRCIVALYKKGVDEIKINYDDPSLISVIQSSIGKEAVGYEIVDQGSTFCVVKQVSGELGDFDSILRRTFLLLVNMSTETVKALETNKLDLMKNIAFLEEANNRFTTTCRRMLNKKGYKNNLIGPIYYIIEDLENLADQYKYMCNYLYERRDKKVKIGKKTIEVVEQVDQVIKDFYALFYKYDKKVLVRIGKQRKEIVGETYQLFTSKLSEEELIIIHHMLVIMQKVFCMVGPYLVLEL